MSKLAIQRHKDYVAMPLGFQVAKLQSRVLIAEQDQGEYAKVGATTKGTFWAIDQSFQLGLQAQSAIGGQWHYGRIATVRWLYRRGKLTLAQALSLAKACQGALKPGDHANAIASGKVKLDDLVQAGIPLIDCDKAWRLGEARKGQRKAKGAQGNWPAYWIASEQTATEQAKAELLTAQRLVSQGKASNATLRQAKAACAATEKVASLRKLQRQEKRNNAQGKVYSKEEIAAMSASLTHLAPVARQGKDNLGMAPISKSEFKRKS